ncbi:MAG: hypothetical protein LBD23_06140, partial [Oscillospiraceae bacterium]|nr:hypothetical protein [Oscillospiraceae bacterium]
MNIESTNKNTITDQLWSVSRIKELTMQRIHASSHQQEQVYFRRHFTGKLAVAAVLTCLIVGLSITAVATNFFGMRDMALPGPDTSYTFESTDGTIYEQPQQFITFTGFSDSPERAASIEWQEFLTTYDIEAALEIYGDLWTRPQEYIHYGAYSPEMVQKIYEITQK